MSEISTSAKHDLVLGGKTFVANHRGQMFLVVGHQVCTHLRRDFVPLLFADLLQVIKVLRLTFGNSNLQLPAKPLQGHNVLLLGQLLYCLGRVFWVIVMLEYPSTSHFQYPGWGNEVLTQDLTVYGTVHHPFDAVKLSCPLSRKTPQSIMFPPLCLTVGMVFLGSKAAFYLLQKWQVWVDTKELNFGLIWPQHFHPVLLWIIQMFIGKSQTGLYMSFLEQGDLAGAAVFQSFTA